MQGLAISIMQDVAISYKQGQLTFPNSQMGKSIIETGSVMFGAQSMQLF